MKPNRTFFLITLLFLAVKSFFLSVNVWWDPAVYIGMGKFIFSLGKSGLWEASRPIVWPTLLGFIWRIGLSPVIFGKVLSLLLAVGCAYLTYLIGREVFDEKIALLAAAFFLFSPTLFFNSDLMMAGIPSTFFGLLAVYHLLKKKYFLMGIFAGITFMTRFLQLIVLAGLLIILFIYRKKLRIKRTDINQIALGFFLIVVPYLLLNIFLYGSMLYPFILQAKLTKFTGWMWWEPLSFYFKNLFKENFLAVFSLLGFFFLFRKKAKKDYRKSSIFVLFLLFFVFYNLNIHKEMRFAITFFPYLYLITSLGLFELLAFVKERKGPIIILSVLLLVLGCETFTQYEREPRITRFDPFWEYVEDVEGTLWITNPVFVVHSDVLVDELIYYSMSTMERFRGLTFKLFKADNLLVNTCDIPCFPGDEPCEKGKEEFMQSVKDRFNVAYNDTFWDCELYIFRR